MFPCYFLDGNLNCAFDYTSALDPGPQTAHFETPKVATKLRGNGRYDRLASPGKEGPVATILPPAEVEGWLWLGFTVEEWIFVAVTHL